MSAMVHRQLDPDAPSAQPAQGGWVPEAVTVNLTPSPDMRDPDTPGREPRWCEQGGLVRYPCRPLQACRTTGESRFDFHLVFRVDGPAPTPAYPAALRSEPITVGAPRQFEGASGASRELPSFQRDVRYAGRGQPIAVQQVTFASREPGLLVFGLAVDTPRDGIRYNGSAECVLIDCV